VFNEKNKEYTVYKGLQKPLVFKTFKGKYIYWAAGGVLGAFVLCILFCLLVSYAAGGIALIAGIISVFAFVDKKQKGGIHSKSKVIGIVPIKPNFKTRNFEKE